MISISAKIRYQRLIRLQRNIFKNFSVFSFLIHLRGESWIRALVVASRAYFSMRSYGRRLELTSILSDTERWEVEVCFRIVLLPSPSKRESHLPSDKLLERLEQRAQ